MPLLRGGGAGSLSNTVWSGPNLLLYQVASSSIQPFGHSRHGTKIGAPPRFWRGGAGSPSNTKSPGPKPTSIPSGILIHPAIWPLQIWPKIGGYAPLGEGSWVPIQHSVARPRPTCMASFILIRPTVWRQYTNVRDRTDRQQSDSIGQTVLQTVAQKSVTVLRFVVHLPFSVLHTNMIHSTICQLQ